MLILLRNARCHRLLSRSLVLLQVILRRMQECGDPRLLVADGLTLRVLMDTHLERLMLLLARNVESALVYDRCEICLVEAAQICGGRSLRSAQKCVIIAI
jgi:hypothetical protein